MTVIAHVGAIPLEETLGFVGPALLVACGVASAQLRARLRQVRSSRERARPPRKNGRAARAGRSESDSGDELVANSERHVADARPI